MLSFSALSDTDPTAVRESLSLWPTEVVRLQVFGVCPKAARSQHRGGRRNFVGVLLCPSSRDLNFAAVGHMNRPTAAYSRTQASESD